MFQLLKKFINDKSGTALVEFAFAAPVFMLGTVGVLQVCILLILQNALDEATYEGARYGVTGYTGSAGSRSASVLQFIQTRAKLYSLNIIKTNTINVTTSAYSTLGDIGNATPTMNNYGTIGQLVQYQSTFTWNSLYIPFDNTTGTTLISKIVVVNEIY